ncbi:hypothetical protein SNE40_013727 [Patella caerulea]|uniref:Uncharacterized protein n=1 Tax=Patella caerulea TaxID=87958 RepID=A0AAN8JIT5_PATCE
MVHVIPRVCEDKSGIVTGLAVGLALFMVLSIVLSSLIAYLILIIRRLTTKEVSNYEGLEVGNRDDNQYASSNVASIPDMSPEHEYNN